MATHDDMLGNELPPPAYQLTDTELDRKIADAAQRSLTLQAEQLQRPTLPPLDEDGFPVWSEDLFNYNQALRQQEVEAASAKLQSEYVRVPTSGTSGASTSSPPPPSRTRPISDALNSKQKEGNFGWLEGSSQRIAQDDDDQGGLNIGRPPYSPPPQTQNLAHSRPGIQVQVGPRPHDVLAQPQSPVSDPDEDLPVPVPAAAAAPSGALGRAPTYYPMGQNHPGARLRRNDTRASVDSTRSELPAWTAEAPSLEGPAYEEVEGGRGMSASPEGRRPPRPVQVQARPQIQERVAGARRSMTGASAAVPYASVSAPPAPPPVPSAPPASRHATSPPRSAPPAAAPSHRPAPIHAQTAPTTSYTPSGYAPSAATRPNAAIFDPGQAYRSNQRYTLSGAVDPISPSAFLEVQSALREGGAGVFYNAAVAATMKGSGAGFVAPPPPPPRFSVPDDDGASVFSGMSGESYGGTAKMSVHSGDKRSSYVPPAGGQGYQGFQAGQAQGFQGQQGFQGGQQGFQGGQPQGFQGGQAQGFQGQAQGGQGQGSLGQGFQQLNPAYQPTGAGYQPPNGQGYRPSNPARMSVLPPPPQGAYNPAANPAGGPSRPLPNAPGFAPPPGNAGGFAPTPPNAGGFVHPPPPGAAPAQPAPVGPGGFMVGRKPAKLYKRL